MKEVRSQLTRLINREPNTADQKPYTSKPEITPETIMSKIAFRTNVKSPRVIMFMGSVRINNMGRKKAFRIPRMAAAQNAEKNPFT